MFVNVSYERLSERTTSPDGKLKAGTFLVIKEPTSAYIIAVGMITGILAAVMLAILIGVTL